MFGAVFTYNQFSSCKFQYTNFPVTTELCGQQ